MTVLLALLLTFGVERGRGHPRNGFKVIGLRPEEALAQRWRRLPSHAAGPVLYGLRPLYGALALRASAVRRIRHAVRPGPT